jgi:hypothetical protein
MNEQTLKTCTSCGYEKSIIKFHKNGKRGRHGVCAVCRNIRRKSWDKSWKKKPERIFKEYKRSAVKRNLTFGISEKDFYSFQNSTCKYCGTDLKQIRLDRVDNSIGYELNNVVPCCSLCNFTKHTLGREEFLEHIYKIYLYQKED